MTVRISDQVPEKSSIGFGRILIPSCGREGRSESTRFGIFAEKRDDVVVVYQRCVHHCDSWRIGIILLRTCPVGSNILRVVALKTVQAKMSDM